jgi:hypothetical protein
VVLTETVAIQGMTRPHTWLLSAIILPYHSNVQAIQLHPVMPIGMIKQEYKIKSGVKKLETINTVLQLKYHHIV